MHITFLVITLNLTFSLRLVSNKPKIVFNLKSNQFLDMCFVMSNINVMSDINLLKYKLISITGSKYENRNRQLWFIDRISEIF